MSLDVSPDPVLPEVLIVRPKRLGDARGWFSETYNEAAFRAAGVEARFIQDNQNRQLQQPIYVSVRNYSTIWIVRRCEK